MGGELNCAAIRWCSICLTTSTELNPLLAEENTPKHQQSGAADAVGQHEKHRLSETAATNLAS
jgi:hypothetical protein